MRKFLRFIPDLQDHLTDSQLASLFCGEMTFVQRWAARQHLKQCWQCRLRKDDLEGLRSERIFARYKNRRREWLSDEPEQEFSRRLRLQMQNFTPPKSRRVFVPKISLPGLPPMNPALVTAMVLAFATVLSFYFWWQQRAPRITSNALLVRAEKWDTASFNSTPGVVYQAVRITMTKDREKETVSRAIYHDTQGKRRPKQIKLDENGERVRSMMITAGLDWDEPLSASGYQNWHDRQHVREDHIVRAGRHLLKLTTIAPQGPVVEQSLTVRDTDFHPVERTLSLRDSGTVEIAEVDFKLLPWSAVDAGVFEPLETMPTSLASSPARVLPFPRLPEVLSEGQIDEAELGARLMLNQLHADTGEDIQIRRRAQGVTVEGVVETEGRKSELKTRLQLVPHVTLAIRSAEEAAAHPSAADDVHTIATDSMPDQLSPLQTYMRAQGRSVGDINSLTQRFFETSLAISQESKVIADLQKRFSPGEQRTAIADATLSELIYSHHQRLEAALRRERDLLAEARDSISSGQDASSPQPVSLIDAAERNLRLTKELTQTQHPAARTANQILAEMSLAMDELVAGAHDAYGKSQGNTNLSGKK
ncbi:MAG: hypothetical protein WDN23_13385 [Edaphobacter sp.]